MELQNDERLHGGRQAASQRKIDQGEIVVITKNYKTHNRKLKIRWGALGFDSVDL